MRIGMLSMFTLIVHLINHIIASFILSPDQYPRSKIYTDTEQWRTPAPCTSTIRILKSNWSPSQVNFSSSLIWPSVNLKLVSTVKEILRTGDKDYIFTVLGLPIVPMLWPHGPGAEWSGVPYTQTSAQGRWNGTAGTWEFGVSVPVLLSSLAGLESFPRVWLIEVNI